MATFHKTSGKPEYEIRQNGKMIGWFFQYYEKSTGHWASRYVGHFPGGYFWEFMPEGDEPGFFNNESFKKGKARILCEYPDDNLFTIQNQSDQLINNLDKVIY